MNAPRPLFPIACLTLLAAGLSACVGNPFAEAQVDPASPVAGEVARLATANRDYPSFSDIPAIPADLRPVRLYGQQAEALKLAGAQLERETAPGTWSLQDTEAFAAEAQRDAGPELDPNETRDTDAFARELRERATPPPPR